jgi:hypothetical protein
MILNNSLLKDKPVIHSDVTGEDIIHLGARTFTYPITMSYSIFRVSPMHVGRPDIISQLMYGSDEYGDLICKINGISNPFELNEGEFILLPAYEDLEHFFITDTIDDETSSDDSMTPAPKLRTEKRRANEAIIGDTRFKIDKEHRIIIY